MTDQGESIRSDSGPQDRILPKISPSETPFHTGLRGRPHLEYRMEKAPKVDSRNPPDPLALANCIARSPDFGSAYVKSGYGKIEDGWIVPVRFPYEDAVLETMLRTIAQIENACETHRHEFSGFPEEIFVSRQPQDMVPAFSLAIATEANRPATTIALSLACPHYAMVPGTPGAGRPRDFASAASAMGDPAMTVAHEPMAEGSWRGAELSSIEDVALSLIVEDDEMRKLFVDSGLAEMMIASRGPGRPCELSIRTLGGQMNRSNPRVDAVARRFNYTGLLGIQKDQSPRHVSTRQSTYDIEGDLVHRQIVKPIASATLSAARRAQMGSDAAVKAARDSVDAFLRDHPVVDATEI